MYTTRTFLKRIKQADFVLKTDEAQTEQNKNDTTTIGWIGPSTCTELKLKRRRKQLWLVRR
jgi:hypothetical protein